jgi:hypothetical protein
MIKMINTFCHKSLAAKSIPRKDIFLLSEPHSLHILLVPEIHSKSLVLYVSIGPLFIHTASLTSSLSHPETPSFRSHYVFTIFRTIFFLHQIIFSNPFLLPTRLRPFLFLLSFFSYVHWIPIYFSIPFCASLAIFYLVPIFHVLYFIF